MHRFHLESRFPSLQFSFYRDQAIDPDRVTVRIRKRGEEGKKNHHDELVDLDTFPDDLFITKCILIGG
jgi:hypothetical protein